MIPALYVSVYRIVETHFDSCFFAFYPFTTAPVPNIQNKIYSHPMHNLLVEQNIYIVLFATLFFSYTNYAILLVCMLRRAKTLNNWLAKYCVYM